jgi:hypothetical protein
MLHDDLLMFISARGSFHLVDMGNVAGVSDRYDA